MRVLFSLTNLELGGAQIFALRLANAFAEKTKQTVYVYHHQPEYFQEGMTDHLFSSVKVVSYSRYAFMRFIIWKLNALILKTGSTFEFRSWVNKKMFLHYLKRKRIDVINSHMSESDFIIANLIDSVNCKFVTTMHGEYEMGKENPNHIGKNMAFVLSKMDGIIYIADKNLDAIKHALPKENPVLIKKICIGITAGNNLLVKRSRQELQIDPSSFVLGMFARGIKEKGWSEAIDAFINLQGLFPYKDLHLILMGNGDYLKHLVEKHAIKNIHLMQFEHNPLDCFPYIELFDATILPSYFPGESVPNSVIESLYWGKPVIASRIGEIPWMLEYKGHLAGSLLDLDASGKVNVTEATSALASYVTDSAMLKQHQSLAYKAFDKFRIESVVDQYIHLFNHV